MKMKLYWVTTDDHHEDWFMIASTAREAAKMHEKYEGYDAGEAIAEKILQIPENISCEKGWPEEQLLIDLGAAFLLDGPTRVVEINGRKFCEGLLEAEIQEITDNIFELYDGRRPNKTKKSSRKQ
jgi:hypothetical protein